VVDRAKLLNSTPTCEGFIFRGRGNAALAGTIQSAVGWSTGRITMRTAPAAAASLPSADAEIARQVAAGDHAAFTQLMRQHNRLLYRTARAILKDDTEAEDAVQDAYLLAYRAIATFRGEAKLSTWLVRIVANEALGRLRRRARTAPVIALIDPVSDGPERAAARAEALRLLESKVDCLPDAFRTVFVLRALEEMSVEETAAVLGIPEATVRSRYFRAKSLVREALASEIDAAFDDAFSFAGERCDRVVAAVLARLRPGAPARS
jgi:RNA polymerase sigma-70 factor, ECF subfamily